MAAAWSGARLVRRPSAHPRPVWNGRLRHGQHRGKAVRVPDVEQHPLGHPSGHPTRGQVDHEQRLPADHLRRVNPPNRTRNSTSLSDPGTSSTASMVPTRMSTCASTSTDTDGLTGAFGDWRTSDIAHLLSPTDLLA